jgi:hypothetical protein
MLALRVTDMEYAPEIRRLLYAAKIDLEAAGVVITGDLDITVTETEDPETHEITVTATDNSTITDEWVQTAMITYVRFSFGSPADHDRLAASYDLQRRQLANATGYTDFGEEETGEDPSTAPGGSAQDDTEGTTEDPSAAPQDDTVGTTEDPSAAPQDDTEGAEEA